MEKKILLIDDDSNILKSFKRQLRNDFDIFTGLSGQEAISILKSEGPFSVIVSDFRMPEMNGIELLSKVRKLFPDTTRIMLTGEADLHTASEAVNEGNVFRFLTKPCPVDILTKTINAGIDQYSLIIAERELLEKTLKGSIKVLIDTMSIISPATFASAQRFRKMSVKLAKRLKKKNVWDIELTALLSQIGCISIPVEIIEKRNKGITLNKTEQNMFLQHPETGSKLLANIPRLEKIVESILYQFKGFDGDGPPYNSISGKQIPLSGRILKVVIDYDYYYENEKSKEDAFKRLLEKKEKYDPDILDALETEVKELELGFVLKSLDLMDLKPGMILAETIKSTSGKMTLVLKGSEITPALKSRLINFSRLGQINEPLKVLIHLEK